MRMGSPCDSSSGPVASIAWTCPDFARPTRTAGPQWSWGSRAQCRPCPCELQVFQSFCMKITIFPLTMVPDCSSSWRPRGHGLRCVDEFVCSGPPCSQCSNGSISINFVFFKQENNRKNLVAFLFAFADQAIDAEEFV